MIATTENITSSNLKYSSRTQFGVASSAPRIRIWLTDDNAIFRNLLEDLLVRTQEFNCERQFHSAEELLEALTNESAPDAILLDVEMGGMTGVDALRPIRALAPDVRVLIVTSFFDPMYEAKAVRDGASAFLIKAQAPQSLVTAIHRALALPVKMAAVAPVDTTSTVNRSCSTTLTESPNQKPTARKNLFVRLTSWAAHLPTNLFRPTPVSTIANT